MQIDLDQIIQSLNDRFDDLNNYPVDDADPIERNRKFLQLHKMLTDLNEEITKYERIRANSQAATFTIDPVSDQERQELESALNSLNTVIQQDEVWHRAISLGTTVLEAAAKIRSKVSAAPSMAGVMAVPPQTRASKRISKLLARHAKPGARSVAGAKKARKARKTN